MQLDSATLLVASSAAIVFLGCALLYFWNLDRASKWLLWWSVPFIIGGAGVVAYLRSNWGSDFAVIGVGNAVRVAAVCMLWQGARVFERRKPMVWLCILVPLLWIELWRGRAERLASRLPAVLTFLSFSVLMLVRAGAVHVLPFPMGVLPLDPTWMGLFNFAVFVHATFLGFLLIAMTKERREAQQRHFALLDPLTGLMNRRAFMSHLERTARRRKVGREPLALLVLDLDHFKLINDRFGHDVGDRVLVAFAGVAEASVRATDQLHRMGGEEFCFILPDTRVPDAVAVAERIRQAFAGVTILAGSQSVAATVSIGIASTDHVGFDLELLHAAADAAMYEAKARGRDRVVVADPAARRSAPPASSGRRRSA